MNQSIDTNYRCIIVTNYEQYMSERGIAPVWSEISII